MALRRKLAGRFQLLERHNMMRNLDDRVDETIWTSTISPEGIVQRWFIADGAIAKTGYKIVETRVKDALHEITSPVSSSLTIVAAVDNFVEPGFLRAILSVAQIDTHAGD